MPDAAGMKPVADLVAAGAGAQRTAVSVHQGMVIIHFDRATEWAAYTAEEARKMGEQLARSAFQAHTGRVPSDAENQSYIAQGMRKRVTKVIREKMVNRTVMLLRNFQEKKPALGYQAQTIVDRILAEVT